MSETDERVVCPQCGGRKYMLALVDYADRSKSGSQQIACHVCDGEGTIDPQRARWIAIGRAHRERRVLAHESVRACAARLGIDALELSLMEFGQMNPARIEDDRPEITADA